MISLTFDLFLILRDACCKSQQEVRVQLSAAEAVEVFIKFLQANQCSCRELFLNVLRFYLNSQAGYWQLLQGSVFKPKTSPYTTADGTITNLRLSGFEMDYFDCLPYSELLQNPIYQEVHKSSLNITVSALYSLNSVNEIYPISNIPYNFKEGGVFWGSMLPKGVLTKPWISAPRQPSCAIVGSKIRISSAKTKPRKVPQRLQLPILKEKGY